MSSEIENGFAFFSSKLLPQDRVRFDRFKNKVLAASNASVDLHQKEVLYFTFIKKLVLFFFNELYLDAHKLQRITYAEMLHLTADYLTEFDVNTILIRDKLIAQKMIELDTFCNDLVNGILYDDIREM